jgi:hypothetical protein
MIPFPINEEVVSVAFDVVQEVIEYAQVELEVPKALLADDGTFPPYDDPKYALLDAYVTEHVYELADNFHSIIKESNWEPATR